MDFFKCFFLCVYYFNNDRWVNYDFKIYRGKVFIKYNFLIWYGNEMSDFGISNDYEVWY